MNLPPVVTPNEWQAALDDLRAKEKEHTRASDALAAARRRLPMVEFRPDFALTGPDGPVSLLDLFEGRRQLIVYHFMWRAMDEPGQRCSGCSMFVDNVGHLAHLHARDTSFVLVSREAPVAGIEQYKERMGWDIPWYSDDEGEFSDACGITRFFGLSVFLRDSERVCRTYFTTGRGVEALGSNWTFLDLTPLGRQELWEDSPAGHPQTAPYEWWRRHDEYEDARQAQEVAR